MNSTNALGLRIHAILMKWILLWWKISGFIQAKMVSQSGQTMYSNASICICIYAISLRLCEWERKTDSNNYWRTWMVYLWLRPRHCWLLVFSLFFNYYVSLVKFISNLIYQNKFRHKFVIGRGYLLLPLQYSFCTYFIYIYKFTINLHFISIFITPSTFFIRFKKLVFLQHFQLNFHRNKK